MYHMMGITREVIILLLLIICTIISSISAFTMTTRSILYGIHTTISCNTIIVLHANPLESLFKKEDEIDNNKEFTSSAKEAEMMHRTAKMMEDHRRSQEAAERTAALMDELASTQVIGKSKAGRNIIEIIIIPTKKNIENSKFLIIFIKS